MFPVVIVDIVFWHSHFRPVEDRRLVHVIPDESVLHSTLECIILEQGDPPFDGQRVEGINPMRRTGPAPAVKDIALLVLDAKALVLEFRDNQWGHVIFPAHGMGVNAVSWAPSAAPGAIARKDGAQQGAGFTRRFVTGGSDNSVKIWQWDAASSQYTQLLELPNGHSDWVRDVAWSPTLLSKTYIASASQDKTVSKPQTVDSSAEGGPSICLNKHVHDTRSS